MMREKPKNRRSSALRIEFGLLMVLVVGMFLWGLWQSILSLWAG